MKTYLLEVFSPSYNDNICLFEVEPIGRENYYGIKKIIYLPKSMTCELSGSYYSIGRINTGAINSGYYEPRDGDKLLKFEDDDAALLWFKLNY